MSRDPYACGGCGETRIFSYLAGSVRLEHYCVTCGKMTTFERVDYDPTDRDAPAEEVAAESDAMGWRINDEGKLTIGGDDE